VLAEAGVLGRRRFGNLVLAGARERLPDDDALLTEIGGVLDSLYAHFGREGTRAKA